MYIRIGNSIVEVAYCENQNHFNQIDLHINSLNIK